MFQYRNGLIWSNENSNVFELSLKSFNTVTVLFELRVDAYPYMMSNIRFNTVTVLFEPNVKMQVNQCVFSFHRPKNVVKGYIVNFKLSFFDVKWIFYYFLGNFKNFCVFYSKFIRCKLTNILYYLIFIKIFGKFKKWSKGYELILQVKCVDFFLVWFKLVLKILLLMLVMYSNAYSEVYELYSFRVIFVNISSTLEKIFQLFQYY